MNELIASHDPASNKMINAEVKTEYELNELSKGYAELAEQAKEEKDEKIQVSFPD